MSRPVIQVQNLAKKYRIGKAVKRPDTLFQTLYNGLKQPLSNLRQIRNLTNLEDDQESISWALQDISFEVFEGDALGIVGNNGAGKSTLLKILSQITEPSSGSARIYGRVAALLEVGTGFHPELTGRENIYMNGTILGMTRREIDQKLEEIVDFSGIEKYIDTASKFYSSGMRVRLGFSVAAHLEPEILIIDEVLAVGDADFQKKCLGKMQGVLTHGRTVLFVSHNMAAVKSLCSKAILLNAGKLELQGPAEKVVDAYLSETAPQSQVVFDTEGFDASKKMALSRIAMISGRGDGTFFINEPMVIEMEFINYLDHSDSHINLQFNSLDGSNVFLSVSGQKRFLTGKFEAACEVPANLLNDIAYSLDIVVVERGVRPMVIQKNVIIIKGVEPPREMAWMGTYPGVIRPTLKWRL